MRFTGQSQNVWLGTPLLTLVVLLLVARTLIVVEVEALSVGPTTTSPSSTSATDILGARTLGKSDLVVSEACLGTMTFGVQNCAADATAQLDMAVDVGVNFLDTAELYPVPLTAPDWRPGATETIVGKYLQQIGPVARDKLVVATKVCGYLPQSPVAAARYVTPPEQPGDCRLDAQSIQTACDASLRRLQTNYIDLYQLHWPDRYVPVFGQTMYRHEQKRDSAVAIEETAAALRDLIEQGKVRYIGLSNETPHGVAQWVQACQQLGIADKLVTIQNSYNLLDRRFDGDLAEICDAHQIGLLPWSILAGGLLSGKYQENNKIVHPPSPNARFIKYPEYMQRWSPQTAAPEALKAVDAYSVIAADAGMTPAMLAIAFMRSRPFIRDYGSVIVGATTTQQLQENLRPFVDNVQLDETTIDAINAVHAQYRDPSCSL